RHYHPKTVNQPFIKLLKCDQNADFITKKARLTVGRSKAVPLLAKSPIREVRDRNSLAVFRAGTGCFSDPRRCFITA
ncbi:MAG TPA: hypothetical protein VKA19_05085, partial [Alphaproteobacteria bacterium]|nr:hypothetical protein [Alphaproteobacteria bacterium]